jgi:hypothetical protein
MTDRNQAEALMAEAGNLAPPLARAQADLDEAQVALNAAQQSAQLAQKAYDQGKAAADETTDRVGKLRKAAANIVGDAGNKDSLTGRFKTFLELAGKLDIEVRNAAAPADAANNSFVAAGATQTGYINNLKKKADDAALSPNDPLRSVIKDDRPGAVLSWSQSAAQQQAGRAYLAGAQAADTIALATQAAAAVKVANEAKVTLDGPACRKEAATRFQNAASVAQAADSRGAPNGDLDRIKWIGVALEATANDGAYLAGNAGALELAKTAKTAAVTRNPALAAPLDWIK